MLIYEYKNERVSSELFSQRQVINETYMEDDQIIIYYPRKLIDVANIHIACILSTQFRAKIFKDNFIKELDSYMVTLKTDRYRIIKSHTYNIIDFQNNSSILFLSKQGYLDRLRGLSLTSIITDPEIDLREFISILRIG